MKENKDTLDPCKTHFKEKTIWFLIKQIFSFEGIHLSQNYNKGVPPLGNKMTQPK